MSGGFAARLLGALLAFGLAGVAVAASDGGGREASPGPGDDFFATKGPIRVHNSRAGRAIVSAEVIAPGDSRTGTAQVSVVGGPAGVSLRLSRLQSPPGPRGGRLADALSLEVRKVGGRRNRLLFSGRPAALGRLHLGRWRAGKLHRYRVRVRFAARRESQDEMQGAEATFALIWGAVGQLHLPQG